MALAFRTSSRHLKILSCKGCVRKVIVIWAKVQIFDYFTLPLSIRKADYAVENSWTSELFSVQVHHICHSFHAVFSWRTYLQARRGILIYIYPSRWILAYMLQSMKRACSPCSKSSVLRRKFEHISLHFWKQ